ncbi:MAG TPA: hypothetical protein VFH38_08880 [Jatrophihabitans sp.]|nr:hypothetical protein [Jatrophihabitans sp.]
MPFWLDLLLIWIVASVPLSALLGTAFREAPPQEPTRPTIKQLIRPRA